MQYLCISCFSQERTLFVVTEECLALLNSCVTTPGKELLTTLTQRENLKLCWECQHHLKRFSRLIKKIEQNAEVLVNNTFVSFQCMSFLLTASVEVYEIGREEVMFDSSKEKEGGGLHIEDLICIKDELNNGFENCNVKKEQHSSEIAVEEDNCFKEELDGNFDEVDHFNDSDNEALTVIAEKNLPEIQQRKEDKKKVEPDKEVTKQKSSVHVKDHNLIEERFKFKTHTEEEVMSAIEELKLNVPQHVKVCNDCGDHFDSDTLYLKHVKTKHDEQIGPYQCGMCKIRFATKGNYNSHKRRHFTTLVCDLCAFECKLREQMTRHLKNVHPPLDAECSCNKCERAFNTKTELKTHRRTCYTCPKCKTVCSSRYHFYAHSRRHNVAEGESDRTYCGICQVYVKTKWFTKHLQTSLKHCDRDNFRYVCSVCGEKLPTSHRLTIHMHSKHKIGKAKYECAHCPKSYMVRNRLAFHLARVHGMGECRPLGKPKVCEVCGKLFANTTVLRSHMNTHSGARPFQCRYCARAFSHHGAYYTHNRLVHRKRVLKDGDYDDHSPLSQCPTCNKSFGTKSKLARHVAKAHGPAADTTHQCLSCDKSFTTANSLQCHYSSKHGGAPLAREHACHLCPKTFSTPASKRQHVKRHFQPTDRVYRCKSCDMTFKYTGALYLHYKLKHLHLKKWQKVKIKNLYNNQEIVVTYDEEGTDKVGQ